MFFTKLYLTFFYSGLSKKASGTVGSIAALPFAYLTLFYLNQFYLIIFSLIIFFISIKIIDNYEKIVKIHDSKEIVIDEVCGVFLAIGLSYNNHFWHFILAFILFRFFDITKPSIIGKVDKKINGGLGVMLDDLLAGFFAAMLCLIFQGLLKNMNLF
ncbi:phosphatidylglycerophosphatase A family protein [Campylobacter canadensis]|uniref:Phosphatidylglycerophosphatase A n=1 Tax=Campylobacter canadensis TaxID=449520 RepID=A0ABS7WPE8_9BACT|nr:phosphatidylglycerophosphatase A [Campylobacter canadensis]MBZ7986642.1 phosphatidylglycerophosphatase A [Campylobacter canadensis]MBZ7993953.1 phosphatidylglycerophosphatase A [Campylobacter canadensis]MBZ7996269.1 phosphatidylglycerophosphatase A [Campylobacter canadensis]MBZ7997678.1 phosphatidylglycerophosphatase A [Campylobacter canadensis]MBZ7999286.1 phosphatidylglycerophosphatase A [Campylobacter canadensis]